jgi:hypothetical protein
MLYAECSNGKCSYAECSYSMHWHTECPVKNFMYIVSLSVAGCIYMECKYAVCCV